MKPAILVSLCILAIGFAVLTMVITDDLTAKQQQISRIKVLLSKVPQTVDIPVFQGKPQDVQELATLSASAVHVEDRATGAELFSLNDTKPRYPASTAKMMTAIVARQIYNLDTPLTVREEVFADGSAIGFKVGEQVTVRNLLAVLLIHSGNDASFVLANNAPGGYDHFIELMNMEATQLGLDGTRFANSSGLDDPLQQSTADDLATLGSELLKDKFLAELVKTKYLTITDVSGKISHPMVNRDELLGEVPGVIGIKTGTTDSAGENLVTAIEKKNRQTLFVVLGSTQRYPEMSQLISWIDRHYVWHTLQVPQQ